MSRMENASGGVRDPRGADAGSFATYFEQTKLDHRLLHDLILR